MISVYGDIQSGNCYKIKLLLALIGLDHQWQHIDILEGDTKTRDFLRMSPSGKIPVLKIDNTTCLNESNAILNYLAHDSDYLPDSRLGRARVLQWQFFEQYSHEPHIAVARFINKYLGLPKERADEYASKQEGGHKALAVMEKQLQKTRFLVGDQMSIADISLYAYTHVAHEGGFTLDDYHGIQAWLSRIQKLPRYVGME